MNAWTLGCGEFHGSNVSKQLAAGNGMNLWVVGQCLLLILGTVAWEPKRPNLKRKLAMLMHDAEQSETDNPCSDSDVEPEAGPI